VRFAALHLSPDAADTDEDKSAIEYARKSTFTIGSAGKSFSVTGWKIGWIVASSDLATHAWFAHQYNCYTVCTPLQEALARAFDATSQSTAYFRELCTLLERNRDRFIECLRGIKALRVVKPGGAYFVLVDISNVAVRSTCERHCS
jgi:aspartate/methionine/tyrosine aminotransferase